MEKTFYPSLFQVNTRVLLTELSKNLAHQATLDDIPDSELDRMAESGFDWIWFLSVWQTGKIGQQVSRQHPEWRKEFEETLPDLEEEDIAGSGFAIKSYHVAGHLGGEQALARLRLRLKERGLKLMLDFVPNHMALDHDWVKNNIDFFITADEKDIESHPENYTRIKSQQGDIILAHGRDPFFPGWPDTLQLNYGNPLLQKAMMDELLRISSVCDGVRCDMAMLVLPDVFEKTWGIQCQPFWPEATRRVKASNPEFCFIAEVYWDMEWTLLQQGFNYAYDKRLYDRLKAGQARPVREHLYAGVDYQGKMARFLENHDEARVAADFILGKHEAAAIITYLTPGLRFFHHGQYRGKKKRISPHLVRGPKEPVNKELENFYFDLLKVLQKPAFRNGNWQLLECAPAWEGNYSNDAFICFSWTGADNQKYLIIVNYSPDQSQCYVKIPFQEQGTCILKDLISSSVYEREWDDLQAKGLYLDEPGWKIYVFEMKLKK